MSVRVNPATEFHWDASKISLTMGRTVRRFVRRIGRQFHHFLREPRRDVHEDVADRDHPPLRPPPVLAPPDPATNNRPIHGIVGGFELGVGGRQSRTSELVHSCFTTAAVLVSQFLIRWASSRMTRSGS